MKPDTLCLTAGYAPKKRRTSPSTHCSVRSYVYDECERLADLFDLRTAGYFYSRVQNPTNDQVAKKICALEGGMVAMLTSSGHTSGLFTRLLRVFETATLMA